MIKFCKGLADPAFVNKPFWGSQVDAYHRRKAFVLRESLSLRKPCLGTGYFQHTS